MPTLVPCPSCACHVESTTCVCPHCGERLRTCGSLPARTAAAALLGLTLAAAGCPTAQNKYDGGTYPTSDTGTETPTGDTGPITTTE